MKPCILHNTQRNQIFPAQAPKVTSAYSKLCVIHPMCFEPRDINQRDVSFRPLPTVPNFDQSNSNIIVKLPISLPLTKCPVGNVYFDEHCSKASLEMLRSIFVTSNQYAQPNTVIIVDCFNSYTLSLFTIRNMELNELIIVDWEQSTCIGRTTIPSSLQPFVSCWFNITQVYVKQFNTVTEDEYFDRKNLSWCVWLLSRCQQEMQVDDDTNNIDLTSIMIEFKKEFVNNLDQQPMESTQDIEQFISICILSEALFQSEINRLWWSKFVSCLTMESLMSM